MPAPTDLNQTVIDSPHARLGIITTGKSYLDVRQALAALGIDDATASAIGLRVLKVGMTWPLDPEGVPRLRRRAGGGAGGRGKTPGAGVPAQGGTV